MSLDFMKSLYPILNQHVWSKLDALACALPPAVRSLARRAKCRDGRFYAAHLVTRALLAWSSTQDDSGEARPCAKRGSFTLGVQGGNLNGTQSGGRTQNLNGNKESRNGAGREEQRHE